MAEPRAVTFYHRLWHDALQVVLPEFVVNSGVNLDGYVRIVWAALRDEGDVDGFTGHKKLPIELPPGSVMGIQEIRPALLEDGIELDGILRVRAIEQIGRLRSKP